MKKIGLLLLLTVLLSGWAPRKKNVLVIGDSISIGYFPFVQQGLADKAVLVHNKGNAQHTGTGLKKIHEWLGQEKWDVIQFNWGLWDLCYRLPWEGNKAGKSDKVNGSLAHTPEQYRANLDSLVTILKKTNAKLLFVTTSYVPENEPGRYVKDAPLYNAVAREVMKKHGIEVNDIYAGSMEIHQKYGEAPNNVHYTPKGYQELATLITRQLEKKIKE
ncbi:signal peptide protein [Rufibacter radiotolerans]|uniref:Signal peptide protein n=1 Tax=Rufibacter radiotolerans TaxID=1379910 RepID=A0A0H4VLE9_9BACT|nr:SGNH/GDSL hydrolase family protein [Rufibacter radiotolerans]AKQ46163.1 signal peptide protein [Rufibacter radiotolerans]